MATVTTMRLTRAQADAIVNTVKADVSCQQRIGKSYWSYLPPGTKLAGSMRNISMMIKSGALWDSSVEITAEEAAQVCTGIAEATSIAIKKAKIPGVAGAETCDRFHWGTAHTATRVNMMKMGAVVFDWHATLRIDNPVIYRTVPDWEKDLEGQVYSTFKGF